MIQILKKFEFQSLIERLSELKKSKGNDKIGKVKVEHQIRLKILLRERDRFYIM